MTDVSWICIGIAAIYQGGYSSPMRHVVLDWVTATCPHKLSYVSSFYHIRSIRANTFVLGSHVAAACVLSQFIRSHGSCESQWEHHSTTKNNCDFLWSPKYINQCASEQRCNGLNYYYYFYLFVSCTRSPYPEIVATKDARSFLEFVVWLSTNRHPSGSASIGICTLNKPACPFIGIGRLR